MANLESAVSIPLILAHLVRQALSNEVIWPCQALSARDIRPIGPEPGSPKYDCEILTAGRDSATSNWLDN
jgi:hypothetical protein